MTRSIRDERGQATVEFALILPVLLLLVLGIIEFGKAWNLAQVATDAVREGARRCVIADKTITQAMVEVDIKNRMAQAGVPTAVSNVAFSTNAPGGGAPCESSGYQATITLTIPYAWMFFRLLDPITLTSSFTMRNE